MVVGAEIRLLGIFVLVLVLTCALVLGLAKLTSRSSRGADQPSAIETASAGAAAREPHILGCDRLIETVSPDGMLRYNSGCAKRDSAGVEHIVRCSDKTRIREWVYTWAERTFDSISSWPVEIYDTRVSRCRSTDSGSADDALILRPGLVVQVRHTAAMSQQHPMDVLTQKYICDDPRTQYRWDYINGRVEAINGAAPFDSARYFVDTGAPCQAMAVPVQRTPWGLAANAIMYPGIDMPMMVAESLEPSLFEDFVAWPRRMPSGNIAFDVLEWLYDDGAVELRRYESPNLLPIGFTEGPTDKKIRLNGFGTRPTDIVDAQGNETYALYTIGTGRFSHLRFYIDDAKNDALMTKKTRWTSPKVCDLSRATTYYVLLPFIQFPGKLQDRSVVFSSDGIEAFGRKLTHRINKVEFTPVSSTSTRIRFNNDENLTRTVTYEPTQKSIVLKNLTVMPISGDR